MKKILALVLVLALVFLTACNSAGPVGTPESPSGSTPENAPTNAPTNAPENTSENAEDEMPSFKFGIIYYSLTDTLGTEVVNKCTELAKMLGCEIQFVLASGTDENVTAVENLCASGCNAILSCWIDSGLPSILQICDRYGVYFGAISRQIPSEEIKQTVEAMPAYKWWVGGVSENDYEAGYRLVQGLVDKGCSKFALVAYAPGSSSSSDGRFSGFMQALADNGLEPVAEGRGNANEQAEFVNTMLTMDIDAFVCTGSGMDRCIQPIMAANKVGEVKLGTVDIGDGAMEALENDYVHVLLGGHAIDAVYSMINTYNFLTGTPLTDGPGNYLLNFMVIDSAETYADYLKYVGLDYEAGDIFPYTLEELKPVLKYYTPDATAEDFQALIDQWSVEDVKTRHADMFD